MAVALDAVGPSSAGAGGLAVTSLTWTHTVATGPSAVVIGASVALTAGTFTATIAGTSTPQLAIQENGGGTGAGNTLMFGLPNISAGAKTVVVTPSATSDMEGGSVSYTGADTVSPFGTPVKNFASSNTPTVTVSGTAATSIVFAVSGCGSSFTAINAGTTRYNNNLSSSSGGGNVYGADIAGGGTGTVTWTDGGPDLWGAIGVEIKIPGAGVTGSAVLTQQASRNRNRRSGKRRLQQSMVPVSAPVSVDALVTPVAVNATASIFLPTVQTGTTV